MDYCLWLVSLNNLGGVDHDYKNLILPNCSSLNLEKVLRVMAVMQGSAVNERNTRPQGLDCSCCHSKVGLCKMLL